MVEKLKNLEWYIYKRGRGKRLENLDFSIIAPDCVGTIMYYDSGLPFLSPTINLTIRMNDFVRFAENFEWYMEQEFVEYEGENECPAGMLADIKVNFFHYETFEQGVLKWEERKKRINWDNLFFVGTDRGGCTYETLLRFDKLPYKKKVVFTHLEYPEIESAYYIKGFEKEHELGNILEFKDQFLKRRYLDDFDYVTFLSEGSRI